VLVIEPVIFYPQMRAAEQLDLFRHGAEAMERGSSGGATRPVIAYDTLDDDSLVAALANAGIRDCATLAAEAARRRLAAAIPVLEVVCLRLTGFGADRIVPEQAAAVEALATIGGADAAQTLVRLIAKRVVLGPCLQRAVRAAAQLEAPLPARTALALLRHDDPRTRADARTPCRKRFLCSMIFLMTCTRMFERQPLALSAASGEEKFVRS
jgi:hypothetical protein